MEKSTHLPPIILANGESLTIEETVRFETSGEVTVLARELFKVGHPHGYRQLPDGSWVDLIEASAVVVEAPKHLPQPSAHESEP